MTETAPKLIDAEKLRQDLFEPDCQPSMRTIREWQRLRIIPSVRLGRLIFFDPVEVRAVLNKRKV
jgi:hypothetical protein